MEHIVLLGLNHKTAPVEIREQLSFSADQVAEALKVLQEIPVIKEVMIFSTCNRVEVLMVSENASIAAEAVKKFLSEYKQISINIFEELLYTHTADACISHLFRVASSLDSMIVGEPQILGQIKDAYHMATSNKASGVILNRLLHKTFSVAKRVRSETGIGDNAVSISFAAVELGRKIFGSLEGKKVLLVGAGDMAELAVESLINYMAGDIFVANRTFSRGVELANRFNGQAVRMEEIDELLRSIDIVISSTGSPDYIITRDQVKGVLRDRKNRPLFFIDIAVPRDIDPEINRMTNSYVYDIDDLQGVIDQNIEDRNKAAIKAERIIEETVIQFKRWYESLDAVPTIVALRSKMDLIAKAEVEKTLQSMRHLSKADSLAITRMTDAMISKILHDPTVFLKEKGHHGKNSNYVDIARKLFKLDDS
jgi:glutamyl-tRNA reductase